MESRLSVIIPTYNMAGHLPNLWTSLIRTRVIEAVDEVLFVDDGSTDDTLRVLEELKKREAYSDKLKVLPLKQNVGRFLARFEGAKVCYGERIIFIDSRVELTDSFGGTLKKLSTQYSSLMGAVEIDVSRSVFCLYWQRSHEFLFKEHFRALKSPFQLNEENFEKYLKGTTFLLCPKNLFLDICEKFKGRQLLNDDTFVIKEIVKVQPVTIHPELKIKWTPRENLSDFLARLWERGPSFVEYHVFNKRAKLFWLVVAGLGGFISWLVVVSLLPAFGIKLALISILLVFASAIFMARTITEFVRIAPLHTAVFFTFAFATLRGLVVNLVKLGRRGL